MEFDEKRLEELTSKSSYDWKKSVEHDQRWWFIKKQIIKLQFFWLDLKEFFISNKTD